MSEQRMRALRLHAARGPLCLDQIAVPQPGAEQILIKVGACGVCRTDLHIVDGELPASKRPLVPGHEIIGCVIATGRGAQRYRVGDRVGVPWLGATCGECRHCASGRENLCERAQFTGYDIDGGYADYAVANERFCLPVPAHYSDAAAAPLLCAGLIGYRSLCMAGEAQHIGTYGFGAAAHILAQVAHAQGRAVYAFTRPGDASAQAFALRMGAAWAGDSGALPPVELDAAIIFAPVGALVPTALKAVRRGGSVVCAGIHMSDIPSFPYALLWGERRIESVANLTRADGEDFMRIAGHMHIRTEVQSFALEHADQALRALREGRVNGAAVLVP